MSINDHEITIEIENLRNSDMGNVKQAFQSLKQMLSEATPEGKNEINNALTWARSVYEQDIG
jgi:hypothetical protein